MNDFESRLHDTLDAQAHQAPDASDLASGARRRMRRRRATRTTVAAAVVAVALPIGFSQFGGLGLGGSQGSGREATVASDGGSEVAPPLADGFRYETWHGVSVQVPIEWEAGAMSAWCSGGETLENVAPVVTRPDTMAIRIACEPANGYGVTLGPPTSDNLGYDKSDGASDGFSYNYLNRDSQRYPQGAWIGSWIDGDGAVTVVTPDRELTQQIIDSAMRVDEVDPNGCPVKKSDAQGGEGVSLCRYVENDLVASRLLTGEQATTALETLRSAPVRAENERCVPPELNQTAGFHDSTIIYQRGEFVGLAYFGECEGVIGVQPTQQMTDDVRALVDIPN